MHDMPDSACNSLGRGGGGGGSEESFYATDYFQAASPKRAVKEADGSTVQTRPPYRAAILLVILFSIYFYILISRYVCP